MTRVGPATPAKADRPRAGRQRSVRGGTARRSAVGLTDAGRTQRGLADQKEVLQRLETLCRNQEALADMIHEAFAGIEYWFQTMAHRLEWEEAETIH